LVLSHGFDDSLLFAVGVGTPRFWWWPLLMFLAHGAVAMGYWIATRPGTARAHSPATT
jgi:hypothetical protein